MIYNAGKKYLIYTCNLTESLSELILTMSEFYLVALYETKSSTKYRKHCDITIIGGSPIPIGSFGALVANIVRCPTYRMKALSSRLSSP
jgi:hypothetical protein